MPFNTIVLGLEELKAAASVLRHRQMLEDIRMMQTAADGMQQYVAAH